MSCHVCGHVHVPECFVGSDNFQRYISSTAAMCTCMCLVPDIGERGPGKVDHFVPCLHAWLSRVCQ